MRQRVLPISIRRIIWQSTEALMKEETNSAALEVKRTSISFSLKVEQCSHRSVLSTWQYGTFLRGSFFNDTARYTKAMNLQQFYIGYKDFGCSNLQSGEAVQLRTFDYGRDSTKDLPKFHCILINQGCHSGDDCHIGGAGTVTYCYGNSCFEYKDPDFGFKAKSVVPRTSKSGGYSDGVNKSCHYKAAFKSYCIENYFEKLVIWDSEELRGLSFSSK